VIALQDRPVEAVRAALKGRRTIGIVSCGGCPALQRLGGTVGIDKWKSLLRDQVEIAWTLIAPFLCDERLLDVQRDEIERRLGAVDVVLVIACRAGEQLAREAFGYTCVSAVETLHFGILRRDGRVEKIGELRMEGEG
jgi:hypothetical protein